MIHVWPDVAAATSPALKVRDQLDYLVWIAEALEPLGFHGGPDLESWRGRVHRAYAALVDAMAPGHGDPLPPDVPPAVRAGTWPDVASASISGMTIRHQLSVIRTVAAHTREDRSFPRNPAEVATWTQRVQTAYDALDHGPTLPVPASARTQPPPPPTPVGKAKKRAVGAASPAARRPTSTPVVPTSSPNRKTPKTVAAEKGPSKKGSTRQAAPQHAVPKKATPKKATPKKAVPKKAVPTRAIPKKGTSKRPTRKKLATRAAPKSTRSRRAR